MTEKSLAYPRQIRSHPVSLDSMRRSRHVSHLVQVVTFDESVIPTLQPANGTSILGATAETSIERIPELWPQVTTVNAKIPNGVSISALSSGPVKMGAEVDE